MPLSSHRRDVLRLCGSAAVAALCWRAFGHEALAASPASGTLKLTDAQWRERLSPQAYDILRKGGTERAFTSVLNKEHRKGRFLCAGCALPLFASVTKFDSGTGWPSFYDHYPRAITTKTDRKFGMTRTEVVCARCAGHLGHVFDDGPKPTGLRYCMNGAAMKFEPA